MRARRIICRPRIRTVLWLGIGLLALHCAAAGPDVPAPDTGLAAQPFRTESRLRRYRKWILVVGVFAAAQTVALRALLLAIRRLHRIERMLRRKEAFNFALFQYNPIETIVVDREGRVVRSNLARRAAGHRQPAIGARMYRDFACRHRIDMHAELMTCIRTGKPKTFPGQPYEDRLLAITISPFAEGAIIISQDVTEAKRTEERLAALNRTFLAFGPDPNANIDRLVSLFGELLGADCALYNRLNATMLCTNVSWREPPGYKSEDEARGHICYDLIESEHRDYLVVRDLPHTPYYDSDPNVKAYNLRTYVGHVVRFGRKRVGSVCAVFQRDFEPSRNDKWLMGVIASAVAVEEERNVSAEELRRNEERFRTIADYTYDTETWFGRDGTLLWINPAVERVTGYTPQACMEMPAFPLDIVHPGDLGRVRDAYARAFRDLTSESNLEYRIRHRDGQIVWIGAFWLPIHDDKGTCIGLRCSLRDITQRRKAEDDRRRMAAQVQQVQKLESLGVLAGGLAHDFNNLLMGILGNTEIALMDIDHDAALRRNLLAIERSSKQAADLCRQLLAYSGKGKFLVEPLDLSETVRETQELIRVLLSKKAETRYRLQDGLPLMEGDMSQIRQVLLNLVTNASEALGDRDGLITVHVTEDTLGAADIAGLTLGEGLSPGRYLCLRVSDNGSGMDARTCSRIFDPFFTTKFAGRGLGLAAVLGIMRSHKGDLRVESAPGTGTTISLYFPPLSAPAAPAAPAAPQACTWRGRGSVLLADDEEMVRTVTDTLLRRIGFEVILAKDGREAVARFQEHADAITLAMLDLTMPGLSGHEALAAIREIRPDVPILLCSGYEAPVPESGSGCGPGVGFVHKPFTLDLLRERIAAVLERTACATPPRPQNVSSDSGKPLRDSAGSSC
jgi:PAS domain S-box-containing protein